MNILRSEQGNSVAEPKWLVIFELLLLGKNKMPDQAEQKQPKRDKYGFVPIGYFMAGFCSSLSGMLFLTDGYLTVTLDTIGVIPVWMWLGSIACGLGLPIMQIPKKP